MNVFQDLFEETPPNLHDLFFFSPYNESNVLTNATVNKSLKIMLDELEIRYITVHGLRHTHASILFYSSPYIYQSLFYETPTCSLDIYSEILHHIKDRLQSYSTTCLNM